MPAKSKIESDKILVKDIFSRMWFRVPEYQRPYVWGQDEVSELLSDLTYAMTEKPESEYFLGSLVFQSKAADPKQGQQFQENDLLDGQQRMTTLCLLFAVIRDITEDIEAKEECQKYIFQKASKYSNIPERTRIVFAIRQEVQQFFEDHVKTDKGTADEESLEALLDKGKDLSVRNMARTVLEVRRFLRTPGGPAPEQLLQFLLNNVLLIYVSTEDLDDAFRLFTILNDRGIPLRNSDILKSLNLGALETQLQKDRYAKLWEEAENELGDDFDRFLYHIRSILVKEKARGSLLQEFEDKIYDPKERDKSTGQPKPILLQLGLKTFQFIERYLEHYRILLGGQNDRDLGDFGYDNLVSLMEASLPATDWVPPLMRYFDKFHYEGLLEFLKRLDNKVSSDWVGQSSPNDRIDAMNRVTKVIDDAKSARDIYTSHCLDIDSESFARAIDGPVYGRRFAPYLVMKLDYIFQNQTQRMHLEKSSIEHVLPQNPADGSQWLRDFSEDQRAFWTDRLGNLVAITGRKNSSQGRLDYAVKKEKYFKACIDACPNSIRLLERHDSWTPNELAENHKLILEKLKEHYGIAI
jgi:hypothetical protein